MRERWFNHLDPLLKHGAWTTEETALLRKLQEAIGNHWCEISKKIEGRSEKAVKEQWKAMASTTFSRGNANEVGVHTTQKCSKGHGLIRFNAPHASMGCDPCGKRGLPINSVMYGCDTCNYDMCASCAGTTAKASAALSSSSSSSN